MKVIDDKEYWTLEEIRIALSGIGIKQEHISTLRNLVNTKKIKYVVDGDKRTSMRYYSAIDKDKILRYFSLTKRRRQLMNLVKVINDDISGLWNVKKSIRIK